MNRSIAGVLIMAILCCQEETSTGADHTNPGLPAEPVEGKYAGCLTVLDTTLDVVTWNLRNFPQHANTIRLLTDMIMTMDADIIALQEVTSADSFSVLMDQLPAYKGVITTTGQLKLGYIYKTAEITSFEPITELFRDNTCAFPRPALMTTITHVTGHQVTFINVHLKCCHDVTASCGAAADRRRQAADVLKDYVDRHLHTANVIILGDWNDGIADATPFGNFVHDAAGFRFADMSIANGNSAGWSYPSYPSHLDHILITNELFDNFGEVRTLKLSACENHYFSQVSDHYPVMLRLK